MRRTIQILALGLCLGGCTQAPKSSDEGTSAGDETAVDADALFAFQLYAKPRRFERPCVFVSPQARRFATSQKAEALLEDLPGDLPVEFQPCFETQEALRAAHPQLHRHTTAMNLASALLHLDTASIVDAPRLYRQPGNRSKLLSPFDLGPNLLWLRDSRHARVPDETLQAPSFSEDGTSLTYDASTVTRPEPDGFVVESERITVTFSDTEWTRTSESLPTVDLQAPRTKAVEDALGGSVEAIMTIPVDDGSWYVAIGPEPGAAPFAWRGSDERVVPHPSWSDLVDAHPDVADSKGLVALAKVLDNHFITGDFHPIRDAAAWKKLYSAEGRDTATRRAYDQGYYDEWVHYTVADFEAISDPSLDGTVLTVYLQGANHQPFRATIDLSTLEIGHRIEPEAMATFTVTSERDGPGPLPPG